MIATENEQNQAYFLGVWMEVSPTVCCVSCLPFTPLFCHCDYLSASHPLTATALSPGLAPPSEPLVCVDSSYHPPGLQDPESRAGGRPMGPYWLTPYPNKSCSMTCFCPYGLTSMCLQVLSHPDFQEHQIISVPSGTCVLLSIIPLSGISSSV